MKFVKHVARDEDFCGSEFDAVSWVSGIYKISLYQKTSLNHGKDIYCAYYKPKGWDFWGIRVDRRTEFYRALKDAIAACRDHASASAKAT